MKDEIENKVTKAGLITLSLEDFYPKGKRLSIDLKEWLFESLILKEKDFRDKLKNHNWEQYQNAFVAVFCSVDAVIPQWAYMLVGSKLQGVAQKTVYGSQQVLETLLLTEAIDASDFSEYKDQRVILKGCGDLPIPPQAYLHFATKMQPLVKSLMFGEACSTVPIYKKPKI